MTTREDLGLEVKRLFETSGLPGIRVETLVKSRWLNVSCVLPETVEYPKGTKEHVVLDVCLRTPGAPAEDQVTGSMLLEDTGTYVSTVDPHNRPLTRTNVRNVTNELITWARRRALANPKEA